MSNRLEGERVFCYQCENEWDRAHGGLQCPRCESEFVEILSPGSRPPTEQEVEDPPEELPYTPPWNRNPTHPARDFHDHNPWAPDPDDGDIRNIHFNTGGGGGGGQGAVRFTSSYTTSFGGRGGRIDANSDPAAQEVMRNFQQMFSNFLGGTAGMAPRTRGGFGGTINITGRTTTFGSGVHDGFPTAMGPPEYDFSTARGDEDEIADMIDSLFSMVFPGSMGNRGPGGMGFFEMLMNPANARSGDHVWSQEAFDRVMSQLMEQNQQIGAPPAPEGLINSLPRKTVNQEMMGSDGKAECSICMDGVEIGTEVTVLPCNHWFHFECIQSWLKEHDTCPHCRKPITPEDQRGQDQQSRSRRRSSRRSSSVASPFAAMDGSRQNPFAIPDSPSGIRNAREQYYGRRTEPHPERPSSERRSSRRSTGSYSDGGGGNGGGGGGGITGWFRSRMPFS